MKMLLTTIAALGFGYPISKRAHAFPSRGPPSYTPCAPLPPNARGAMAPWDILSTTIVIYTTMR